MVKKIGIGFLVALAVLAGVVVTRPSAFHLERSTRIDAPPDQVFSLVNDFHAWSRWSPWEKLDPAMRREFSGANAGAGASYGWVGNHAAGQGRMTITESVPSARIAIQLEFLKPMTATNQVEFAFEPSGDGTRVVWGMDGPNGFVGKLFALFVDVDTMVGKDFESGLAAMKAAAESDAGKAHE